MFLLFWSIASELSSSLMYNLNTVFLSFFKRERPLSRAYLTLSFQSALKVFSGNENKKDPYYIYE